MPPRSLDQRRGVPTRIRRRRSRFNNRPRINPRSQVPRSRTYSSRALARVIVAHLSRSLDASQLASRLEPGRRHALEQWKQHLLQKLQSNDHEGSPTLLFEPTETSNQGGTMPVMTTSMRSDVNLVVFNRGEHTREVQRWSVEGIGRAIGGWMIENWSKKLIKAILNAILDWAARSGYISAESLSQSKSLVQQI